MIEAIGNILLASKTLKEIIIGYNLAKYTNLYRAFKRCVINLTKILRLVNKQYLNFYPKYNNRISKGLYNFNTL
jgi:hypothetical protein